MYQDGTATVMMKPVCQCGHIFRKLNIEELTIKADDYPFVTKTFFNPDRCPACGRSINCIASQTSHVGKFEYDETRWNLNQKKGMTNYFPIIAVDFDGTLCEDKWPEIGAPNEELFSYLKLQQRRYGVRLILWTCRSGERLQNAVNFCSKHGLEFDAVNENLPDVIEMYGDNTRKISADIYIDDKADHRFNLPFSSNNNKIGRMWDKNEP